MTMYKKAFLKFKTKKYIILTSLFFTGFMMIYFIIDSLNMSYNEMIDQYGLYLVLINIALNLLMSMLSTLLMLLSTDMVELKGKEGKGSIFGFISVLFGILTYGCTTCVITFFASIGIAFSVIALPLGGLPYKLISLFLLLIGHFLIYYELTHSKCRVNIKHASK